MQSSNIMTTYKGSPKNKEETLATLKNYIAKIEAKLLEENTTFSIRYFLYTLRNHVQTAIPISGKEVADQLSFIINSEQFLSLSKIELLEKINICLQKTIEDTNKFVSSTLINMIQDLVEPEELKLEEAEAADSIQPQDSICLSRITESLLERIEKETNETENQISLRETKSIFISKIEPQEKSVEQISEELNQLNNSLNEITLSPALQKSSLPNQNYNTTEITPSSSQIISNPYEKFVNPGSTYKIQERLSNSPNQAKPAQKNQVPQNFMGDKVNQTVTNAGNYAFNGVINLACAVNRWLNTPKQQTAPQANTTKRYA